MLRYLTREGDWIGVQAHRPEYEDAKVDVIVGAVALAVLCRFVFEEFGISTHGLDELVDELKRDEGSEA